MKDASSLSYGPRSQLQMHYLHEIATSPVNRISAECLNSTWQFKNKV